MSSTVPYTAGTNSGGSNAFLLDLGNAGITSIVTKTLIAFLILLLLIRLTFLFYRCFPTAAAPAAAARPNDQQPQEGNRGQNNAAINFDAFNSTCPSFPYTKDKAAGEDTTCVICLSEYVESEMIRKMPQCGHYFHLNCLDQWLKINRSCPVCRDIPSVQAAAPPSPDS